MKKSRLYTKRIRVLSEENKTVLNNFYKYLKGKRYSISTIRIYTFFVAYFILNNNLNQRTIEQLLKTTLNVYISGKYDKTDLVKMIAAFYYKYPNIQDRPLFLDVENKNISIKDFGYR